MPQSTRMSARLHQAWQRRGLVAWLLRPLSWLALAITSYKRLAYRRGWKPAYRSDVPVLVVGNLYVGGTGKTPFLLAALAELRARGWHPGVVSRGYGANVGQAPRTGTGELAAAEFGDEPSLIARQSGVPISVHPRRALAAQALRARHPEVDLILADDGLQHLALARDLEILVEDARGIGNGLVLPAGPLRESASRRQGVDVIVKNVGSQALQAGHTPKDARPALVQMRVSPAGATRLSDGRHCTLAELAQPGQRIAAVAGIGQPERYFDSLRQAGLELSRTLALPDHFDYASSPFAALQAEVILITEKDAVKCAHLHDERLWAVPVSVQFSDPFFFDWLHARLLACSHSHLDTPIHGHTPA